MSQSLTFKELRRNVIGWTQTRMAQEMGVTVRTIYRYETTGAPARALKLAQRIYKEQTQRMPT